METSENCIGGMNVQFVQEYLSDFNCTLAEVKSDDTLNKLNALSTTYSITNVNLVSGLIAFMKNIKMNELSLSVLDDYEQELSKMSKNLIVRARPSINLQSEREILKELCLTDPIENSVEDEESEEIMQRCFDYQSFDDDKNYAALQKRHSSMNNNSTNSKFGRAIKSRYTGSSFKQSQDNNPMDHSPMISSVKILSDCQSSSYSYGHSNVSNDICEIFSSDLTETEQQCGEDSQQKLPVVVSGLIFPSEGISLNFDNALLHTNSDTFHLDFENIEMISIYPGMKISANCLHENDICHIQKVIESIPPEMPMLVHLSQLSRLRVLIACGPYLSLNGNSNQLEHLLNSDLLTHANALILAGPFVPNDVEVKAESPQIAFANFLNLLSKYIANKRIRTFLLPNAQSDLYSMPYFPTPALTIPTNFTSEKAKLFTFLPDPAVFEIEGIRFAVSTSEILVHLCRGERYKATNMENEDRMNRLVSHLFRSRSLYPLYPSDPSLALSLTNSYNKLHLNEKPHVLILPSVLPPIAKVVEECVFINPGRFIRGKISGTFSLIDVDLDSAMASSSTGAGAASISQFCQVSLLATQN